jgi:hypothetical protein
MIRKANDAEKFSSSKSLGRFGVAMISQNL